MASSILYLNGQDADSDLGLIPIAMGGLLGAPAKALGLLDIPGLPGTFDSGVTPRESTRTLSIDALVQASSETTLYASLDAIKEACGTGLVEIKGPYSSTRAFYGTLMPFDTEPFVSTMLNGWARVTLQFLCAQPYAVALTNDTISFGSTATDVPLGTAPSVGRDDWSAIIEIIGAATTPTLTELDSAGNTVGTMVFTYSPVAGDHIRIDVGRRLVQRCVSGTWSNAFSLVTAGYSWPQLDPANGYVAGSLWPKLKVSSGTGVLTYLKHYR